MVLRQESGPLRDAAHAALAQMDNADVIPILRQHHEIETNAAGPRDARATAAPALRL